MIQHLFSTLTNISNSTKLLEACDWSEERAQSIVILCTSAMEEIRLSGKEIRSYEDLKAEISNYLIGSHTQSEIDILLEIIHDEMSNDTNIITGEC
jgi:hypothetical protein